MDNLKEPRVALYVDCENLPYKKCDDIIEIANKYGNVIMKKAYANWSGIGEGWSDKIKEWAFKAEHQVPFANGKNSSDIGIVIDILLKLFEKEIDIFVIASSDSDFTSLVIELKERDKKVIGIGMQNSSGAYRNSFHTFHFLEDEKKKNKDVKNKPNIPKEQLNTLRTIVNELLEDGGKAYLSRITDSMRKMYPSFIHKNYNYTSMKDFIVALLPEYRCATGSDRKTVYLLKKKD